MVPGRSLRGERRLEELTIQRKRKAILTRAVNGDWTGSGELENSKWLRRWGVWPTAYEPEAEEFGLNYVGSRSTGETCPYLVWNQISAPLKVPGGRSITSHLH